MTKEIYEARDKAASNSYTLHNIPLIIPAAISDCITDNRNKMEAVQFMRKMFIGNVTFKRAASGMQTTCYLHIFGFPIVKAIAKGCGYDVQSEAFRNAYCKFLGLPEGGNSYGIESKEYTLLTAKLNNVITAIDKKGLRWKDALETEAGIFAAHIGG